MPKGHIVFDCDGTLISSADMVFNSVAQVLSEHFGREVDKNEVIKNFDADIETMYSRFGIDTAKDMESLQRRWCEVAVDRKHQYDLFDGIVPLLDYLKSSDYALYVWTARDKASTLQILEDLKVLSYFWDIKSGTCGPVKPNPAGLEEMVGHLDRKKVVMLGDSYTDIDGAKSFGCHSVGVTWCHHANTGLLQKHKADYLLNHPLDFLTVLNDIFDENLPKETKNV